MDKDEVQVLTYLSVAFCFCPDINNNTYHNLNIIPTFFKGSHYKVVA